MAVWFRTFARRLITVICAATIAAGGSPALAGTTGALIGTVTDAANGAPLAGVKVTLNSPSQVASTLTDSKGNFVFASMAPDTYTLTMEKDSFEPNSTTGVSVLADQTQRLNFKMQKSLKTIATVTTRSSLNLVRSGTTTDVYSVNPAVTRAAAPIGGGGGLNNAYSAIAAMPGAFVPNGQMGVNQTVYIRGGYYDQIGYEYDGVPVNRSFDNYPAHSASTLGQQELQIYAGGGGANSNATGLAGFINQVTKTGTYPGYATGLLGIAAPTFYHQAQVEVGGATPDRLFSYYAGFSGADQDFRYLDNTNGADVVNQFPYNTGPSNLTTETDFYPAMYPTCSPTTAKYTNPVANKLTTDPGCYATFYNVAYSNPSYIADRQAVANFHFGIPHKKDGGKDDVQILYTTSAEFRQYYSSVNDAGAPLVNGLLQQGDLDGPPHWPDYYTYPGGTQFLAPSSTPKIAYQFPGSPTNRCSNVAGVASSCPDGTVSALPDDYRDGRWDTASILKLQYQKNFGSSAYLRVFGYTFYSDTNRSGATRRGIGSGFGAQNYDYEVDGHTRGAQMDFGDQINSNNQINASVNYIKSSALRDNNYNYDNGPYQQTTNLTNGTLCYAFHSGLAANGIDHFNAGQEAPCNDPITQGTFISPNQGEPPNPCSLKDFAGSAACSAGAQFRLTYTGNQALINAVTPAFTNVALGDEWRPTDKLDVNLALKYASDNFYLQNTNTPGKNFWFAAAQREFCYNPNTDQPVLVPQPPQDASTVEPYVSFNCPIDKSSGTPVQTVHPDGKDGHLLISNVYPSVYNQNYWQPRIGMTFTANPDTVFRISAGRYAQEPQNYEIQYNSLEENLASELIGFLPYGFTTPFHDAQAQFSDNYDLSYERHFKGTDMSLKLTPYYRFATDQLDENINIPTLLASPALNAGTEISKGVELEFTKGDFARNGLAAVFSYTYLNSVEKWNNFQGITENAVDPYNQYIQAYNALTKAGGGAPCYSRNGNATPLQHCLVNSILNPYYNMPAQPLYDKNAYYVTGLDFPYTSPNVFSLILNYKHNRFAITPAITLNEGATYGSSADVIGIDPRECSANQRSIGITGNPQAADYTSCAFAATPTGNLYIPNPQTGHFDGFGQFRQPWQMNMGLSLHYDVSPRISANMIVANLFNACFGGSAEPWTAANPPSSIVCGYSPNAFYISNFYNGTSPNDRAANGVPLNPYFANSFIPSYGDNNSFNYPLPLNVYITVQVKL
jgi:Carboxypeptidase regulatory-like domain/TonB dependent receptor